MKLLNDFYKILETEKTDDSLRCSVRMNGGHFIYKAHFPGNPITPGVCLVQIATELLREVGGLCLVLRDIPRIRYRNAVKPEDKLCFVFDRMKADKDFFHVRVHINSDKGNCVQMTLKYKRADERP